MNTLSDFASGTALDLLVRISLILAVAWLLAGALRQRAAIRHAILLAGIVSSCALPVAMWAASAFPVPRWSIEVATAATPVSAEQTGSVCLITTKSQENFVVRSTNGTTPAESTITVEPCDTASAESTINHFPTATTGFASSNFNWPLVLSLVVAAWAVVAVLRICGLALSLARLQRIVHRAPAVAPQLAPTLLNRIQRRVGLTEPLKLRESAEVSAPLAAGIIGNYILVPAGWTNRLSRTELDSVLCHEAAHLARRDHRVVLLQELLASLLWFHPLVHLVNRALTRAREEICDNYAIRSIDRPAYCAALFRLAGGRPHDSLLAATSLSSRHWPLEERIRGILDEARPTITGNSRPIRFAITALAVGLCVLTTLPAITAAETELDGSKQGASPANVEVRHIRGEQAIEGDVRSIRITSQGSNLQIDSSDDGKLLVEAIVRIDTKQVDPSSVSIKLDDYVEISTADGVLAITPRIDNDQPTKGLQVDLALAVPSGLAIEAQSNDGDISVNQIEAGLTLAANDGNIAVKSHASSSVTAASHDGDIAIDAKTVAGKLALSAHDGNISVRADAVRTDLNAESFDGSITINAGSVTGRLNAQSNEGNVTVKLTDQVSVAGQISLASQEGDLVLDAGAATRVAATTAEGSIVLHLVGSGVQEELAASTSAGNVELTVSPETNADLALVTRNGQIKIEGLENSGNLISTRLGKGGPKYAIATNDGSILIKTVTEKAPAAQ